MTVDEASQILPKVIVILGPTASGKTDLSLRLAKKFNGEVVSVDSRQIYKKMIIGTVQPKGKWRKFEEGSAYVVDGVRHYLMNIVDPGRELSSAQYRELAIEHINDILRRGRVPFLVGGTGMYIWAIIDNLDIPRVPPNKKLRRSLEVKPAKELVLLLKKLDPIAAVTIDLNNPRRVLRALEVAILSGESLVEKRGQLPPLFSALQIGVTRDRQVLYQRIATRVQEQIGEGLVEETRKLMRQKYGWQLPSMSGIGYRQMGMYLRGECTLDEAADLLRRDTCRYAKRQMTWFKRDKRIRWIDGDETPVVEKLVSDFLSS